MARGYTANNIQRKTSFKKEYVAVQKLLNALKEADILSCGETFFRSLLINIVFKLIKCQSNTKEPSIVNGGLNTSKT
jgi:hypothetical protein